MRNFAMLATAALVLFGPTGAMVSADAAAPADAHAFILNGLVVYGDGQGRAWLQEKTLTGNQVVVVRPGDTVGPWKVTRILPGRVELEGPAGKISVLLAYGGGGANVARTPPAPAVGPPVTAPPPAPAVGAATPAPPATVPAPAPAIAPAPATTEAAPDPQTPGGAGPRRPGRDPAMQPRVAEQPSGGDATPARPAAAPASPSPAAAVEAPAPAAVNSNTVHLPLGDPRRREGIRMLFGPR